MGKIAKQDRKTSTKSAPVKNPGQAANGKPAKTPQVSSDGTNNHHTPLKGKISPATKADVPTKQKGGPVKEVIPSKNAVEPDLVPPKPSDVVRKQKLQSANPGHVSSVEAAVLSPRNDPEPEMTPSTKVETETSIPVSEAAANLEKRVANEMAEKEQIRSSASKEMKSQESHHSADSKQVGQTAVEFCWNASPAKSVQITGSFSKWEQKLDMTEDDGAWKSTILLPKGRHAYKFIVDGEWCYDITKEHESDNDGNINNIVTV